MYGPPKEKKVQSVLVKLGIGFGVLGVIAMITAVGWLIVKVTQDTPQPSSTASSAPKTDNGSGLSLGDASGTGTNNDIALQGITQSGGGTAQSQSSQQAQTQKSIPAPGAAPTAQDPKPVRSQTLPNGLKIDEYVYGTGERATKQGDTVAVHYVGYLTNGQVFDTSLKGEKKPFAFKLGTGQVIQGWDIGLQDMHLNSVRRITIPAALAYGAKGYPPSIPANATLIFDVQLMAIQ